MNRKRFPRWLEEIFPFAAYLQAKWNIDHEIDNVMKGISVSKQIEDAWKCYCMLDVGELLSCLSSEYERSDGIIEKTFKFGAGLATALTISSVAIALVGEKLSGMGWKIAFVAAIGPAFCYIAAGGILGLSAIRAQRRFGWGPEALAERKNKSDQDLVKLVARDLALQQRLGIINVMRNEAAFMSLRNGFLLAILAILFALAGLAIGS